MVNHKKLRIVKISSVRYTFYVIQIKVMFWWVRYNEYEYTALDDALRVISYTQDTKEQVWP